MRDLTKGIPDFRSIRVLDLKKALFDITIPVYVKEGLNVQPVHEGKERRHGGKCQDFQSEHMQPLPGGQKVAG